MKPALLFLLACLLTACAMQREGMPGHFVARQVQIDGAMHRYQVFVPSPAAYRGKPALVLFLHGSGERGSDNTSQLDAGLGVYLKQHTRDFPALVVLPQVPGEEEWTDTNARVALAAQQAALAEFNADPRRVYATGMSMGGYGTWEVAMLAPERFAALVPVCGAVHPPRPERPTLRVTAVDGATDPYATIARRLRGMPVWMFHGALDDVVATHDDHQLVAALNAVGTPVRYTEYPQGNHNAWDATYADPAMWAWLFAQRRD